jgi:shikimate kinase
MNPSTNLFLIGPMGAGKSTVGRRLADQWNLQFIDLDQEIENRNGVSIEWIFEVEGEPGFRARERALLTEVTQLHGILLATGGGSIVIPDNRQQLAKTGFVVYLKLSVDEQLDRLKRDRKRPLLDTNDRKMRLETLSAERSPHYEATADLIWTSNSTNTLQSVTNLSRALERTWKQIKVMPQK